MLFWTSATAGVLVDCGHDPNRGGTTSIPDGLSRTNDVLALGVMQSLPMLLTRRITDDVAPVGYDDIDFAASAVVPLP
ncbi:hypothetical protein AAGW05_15875 [Arthrobacter sp. LAPM80]|uniref:hypothetical protein n=1 Tax=Arthrobacter sp. LAPM80 TaxID=3141788 RepID=UPI00398A8F8E